MRICIFSIMAIISAIFIISCSSPEKESLFIDNSNITIYNLKENSDIYIFYNGIIKKYKNIDSTFNIISEAQVESLIVNSNNIYILEPNKKIDITDIKQKIDLYYSDSSIQTLSINKIDFVDPNFHTVYYNTNLNIDVLLKNGTEFDYDIKNNIEYLNIPEENKKHTLLSSLGSYQEININLFKDCPYDIYNYNVSKKIKDLRSKEDVIDIIKLLESPVNSISENNINWNQINEDEFLKILDR